MFKFLISKQSSHRMKLYGVFILLLSFCFCCSLCAGESNQMKCSTWKLNTSNPGKFEEFKRLFAKYGSTLETSHIDLKEIDADPIKVVAHKASQLGENIIVEDTSLDIEGASVGINIRWLLDHLTEYAGRKAEWTVLLAFRLDNQIYIYKGSVSGTIVQPEGQQALGSILFFYQMDLLRLWQNLNLICSMQGQKLLNLCYKEMFGLKHPVIENWEGPWQKSDH